MKKNNSTKRLFGLKVPKPVRKIAANPATLALLAGAAVAGGLALARNKRLQHAMFVAGEELKRAGASAGYALSSAGRAAIAPIVAAAQGPGRSASKRNGKAKGREADPS